MLGVWKEAGRARQGVWRQGLRHRTWFRFFAVHTPVRPQQRTNSCTDKSPFLLDLESPGRVVGASSTDAIPPPPPHLTPLSPLHSQVGPTGEPRLWGLCPPLLGGQVFYPLVTEAYFLHWDKNLRASISLNHLEHPFLTPAHMLSDFSQNPQLADQAGPSSPSPAHGRCHHPLRGATAGVGLCSLSGVLSQLCLTQLDLWKQDRPHGLHFQQGICCFCASAWEPSRSPAQTSRPNQSCVLGQTAQPHEGMIAFGCNIVASGFSHSVLE